MCYVLMIKDKSLRSKHVCYLIIKYVNYKYRRLQHKIATNEKLHFEYNLAKFQSVQTNITKTMS